MKQLPTLAIGLSVLSMFVISYTASADCVREDNVDVGAVKKKFAEAKRIEEKGDYMRAYQSLPYTGCDFPDNALEGEIEKARYRLGPKVASQIEDKDPKKACELYQRYSDNSNNHKHAKDADRAILKYAKTVPFDKPGGFLACSPSGDTKIKTELGAIASRNADKVLEKEVGLFKKMHSRDEMLDSNGLLRTAHDWSRIYPIENKLVSAKVEEIAIKHGDTLKARSDVRSLEYAIDYYDLFNRNDDKIKAVLVKASGLGDGALKKKDFKLAVEYFEVARDHKKKEEALMFIKEIEEEKDEEEKRADVREAKRQKDFKKDTDKLEKELGL